MNPKTALNIKSDSNPQTLLNEWIKEYDAIAAEFSAYEDICGALKSRAVYAFKLYKERAEYVAEPCHDEAYYEEFAQNRESEELFLDGDFPLGNEYDADFANSFFSVAELAKMQCGLLRMIVAGDFNGHNFDVLVRKGFIAELDRNWNEAVRCYEGVSTSQSVQEREYECRRKAAAADGDVDAIWQMAQLCKKQNKPSEAADWLNEAIEMDYPEALLSVARVHLDKNECFYNKKLAKNYLCRAADAGSAKAMIALGDMELTDTDISFPQQAAQLNNSEHPDKKPKMKIRRQHKKQMAWYRLAAEAGNTDAMNGLSMAYHLGYPEKRIDREAFLWASRAADKGDGSGMYQTAYFYENGFGTDKDTDAALLLYTEAAEKGVRSAMVRLYEIYTNGHENIKPDGKKAAHYLFMSNEEHESGGEKSDED